MRIGAVFPGQGSQQVGMGWDLVQSSPLAAGLFARASRILGYDVLAIARDGPEERLRETKFSQPAIFITNYALAAVAAEHLEFAASAGHSFGEYCSLTLAGAMTYDDAVALVNERALAMQAAAEIAPGAMAAVLGLDVVPLRAAIEKAKSEGCVQLANFNSPGQIVVSGDVAAVRLTGELAMEAGAKRVVPLNVSGAWHSELMAPARERFAPYVQRASIRMPQFTVVSNVDAKPYEDVATIRRNLIRSVTDEVLWHETSLRLAATGLDAIVEFGASSVLAPLLRRVPGVPSVKHAGDAAGVAKLLASLQESPA